MMLLLKYTLMYMMVLMLVALGGMFSERSGIINIALEGIMVIGGLVGVLMTRMLPTDMPAWAMVTLSILGSAISGAIYSALLAFASVNLKADQTIGGTALNLLATALALVAAKRFNGSQSGGFRQLCVLLQHRASDPERVLLHWHCDPDRRLCGAL